MRSRKETTDKLENTDLPVGGQERQTRQQVELSATKYVKKRNLLLNWIATERPRDKPSSNLDSAASTVTSINNFVWLFGVELTHTKNLMIQKLRETRENSGLEVEEEQVEPAIGKNFQTKL